MNRVAVRPELVRWALDRSGRSVEGLSPKFPKLVAWEQGEAQPTLRQLEQFAKATYTPVGYLFLREPPVEQIPIPDFRTFPGAFRDRPSPDLLDTIYLCQQRQEWYREFARTMGEAPLGFAGSARVTDDVVATAAAMRRAFGFDLDERRRLPTWSEALHRFIEQADALGVLVMVSGVVGSKPPQARPRGVPRLRALRRARAARLRQRRRHQGGPDVHAGSRAGACLARRVGASDVSPASSPAQRVESWCNRVASELLVPPHALREALPPDEALDEVPALARRFKVSTLVILRRLLDARRLPREAFEAAYATELERLRAQRKTSGGDFYLTLGARAGKTFARALVISTLEGRTSFTEAFRLLGFKKMATFRELGESLGVGF